MSSFESSVFSHLSRMKLALPDGALSRRPKLQPRPSHRVTQVVHPRPHYNMWRGNHMKYTYNKSMSGEWGESDTRHRYHQYFSHAKDRTDYGRTGRDFQLVSTTRGKMDRKPLPTPQYVSATSKPKWIFKTWHDAHDTNEMWQRELQYEEHIPKHLNVQRPLAIMAPRGKHNHLQSTYIEKLEILISPLLFGFGDSLQKAAMDFYRRCLSSCSYMQKEKLGLIYSVDHISPQIIVTWTDGTIFAPPLFDGVQAHHLIQQIMEMSWLIADRMDAAGRKLVPQAIDDYKWHEVIEKKKKKVDPKKVKK